jgi:hypothetical protein
VLSSAHVDDRGFVAGLGLVVGWSYIGTGLFAWWRRPGNRTGPLMAAAGLAWFASGMSASDDDLMFTVGIALDALFPATLGHPAGLGQAPGESALRVALADALGDPTVALAYWLPESQRYVDALDHPVTVSGAGWTHVDVQGRRIAAIAHDPALDEEPQLVRAAGAAAALALENQRLEAELRARIEELRASRARLVEAGDAKRRSRARRANRAGQPAGGRHPAARRVPALNDEGPSSERPDVRDGARGIRTPDLSAASRTLSQLSYSPELVLLGPVYRE